METKVITYGPLEQRLAFVKAFLAEMAQLGQRVQLVHPAVDTARALEAALDVPVLCGYDFNWAHVDADCIAVLDGDIIDTRTVKRLEYWRKNVYLMAPAGAITASPASLVLADVLRGANLVPYLVDDEEQPRTAACHHFAPTCMNCDSMVTQWKAERRDRAAPLAA